MSLKPPEDTFTNTVAGAAAYEEYRAHLEGLGDDEDEYLDDDWCEREREEDYEEDDDLGDNGDGTYGPP